MLTIPFATIEQADTYHADHMFGAIWEEEMETEDKRRALITASRLLIDHLPWLPAYIETVSVAPLALVEATSEFARRLFERGDPFSASGDNEGIKAMKAGPVDIEFADSASSASSGAVVPPEVAAMLHSIAPTWHRSSINVPLVRY